jgi:hypothetical protein
LILGTQWCSECGLEKENPWEKTESAINTEVAQVHAMHMKVQHHNPQVKDLVEDAEALEGIPLGRTP